MPRTPSPFDLPPEFYQDDALLLGKKLEEAAASRDLSVEALAEQEPELLERTLIEVLGELGIGPEIKTKQQAESDEA
ncbi:MAG: hypothetical protein JWO96_15 [Candidatus Saccharibacteria bacterium]|nr:hypothetical protein [Candidatus Saccharibacteria bacterium]